jgi:hypothetical protein
MSPRYETDADLLRERAVIERFQADGRQEWTFIKQAFGHVGDYIGIEPSGKRWLIEVKTRTCESDRYPTYILSHRKVQSLIAESQRVSARPLVLVWWQGDDVLGGIPARHFLKKATVVTGGRYDRPEAANDIEQMLDVQITEFRRIP